MPPKAKYTVEQVDDLCNKLEKAAERQIANKSSAVKLRAAERDLLALAEDSRNVCEVAIKGDKVYLAEVFGGRCEHIGRMHVVVDMIEFSDMHKSDQRWGHLRARVLAIEEVLKDLGSFKPWQIGSHPPSNIVYELSSKVFAPGDRVKIAPSCEGGAATSFKVAPLLPEGLRLNESTGVLDGLLRAGKEVEEQTYVVTVANEFGECTSDIVFSVQTPAPTSLAYEDVPDECYTGEHVQWPAILEGGLPKSWAVEPDLPRGLTLDAESGTVTGMLLDTADSTCYNIAASNKGGEVTAALTFAVKVAPPISLSYPELSEEYFYGEGIHLVPNIVMKKSVQSAAAVPSKPSDRRGSRKSLGASVASAVVYTIEPSLPEGLVFSEITGIISGHGGARAEMTSYRIAATNEGGETAAEIAFCVRLTPPEGLSYPELVGTYYTSQPLTLTPHFTGIVSEWSVEPELPSGLDLDQATGEIIGMPSEITATGTWAVTARNAEGSSSAELSFTVVRAPPTSLGFPEAAAAYPVGRPFEISPIVEGEVDEFTISPPLPPGLALDASTGVIDGTPSGPTDEVPYVVTAKNETGTASVTLTFAVRVIPPESLTYPTVDDWYNVGEDVVLEPEVEGGATTWEVEPVLPEGLTFDAATGAIGGVPVVEAEEASYVVTASNEAGGTSVVLTFAVTAPPPVSLSYASHSADFAVGEEVPPLEPELEGGLCAVFSAEPALPEGLDLDVKTGAITGTPTTETEEKTYTITAKNAGGTTSATLTFACSEQCELEEAIIDEGFASQLENITDISKLVYEPSKDKSSGDWMVWMVHRAWLNDPELTDFNFSNLQMPLPHLEARVAPKLMKALETNTSIKTLILSNSNMQRPQGHELAISLQSNTTLKFLNLECNNLDSESVRAIAAALKENRKSALETWRFSSQKHVGTYFGRPVEQAIAELMEKNESLVKLGFTCHDAHWRLIIDRNILRNVDFARRRRKRSTHGGPAMLVAEEKSVSRLQLATPPADKAVWEIFADDDEKTTLVRGYVADKKGMPSTAQIQSFAKGQGKGLPYSAVAPLIKDFRAKLMAAATGTEVVVTDTYGTEIRGELRGWTEKNENWSLDVWTADSKRYNFTAPKQPAIEVADEFAAWIKPVA